MVRGAAVGAFVGLVVTWLFVPRDVQWAPRSLGFDHARSKPELHRCPASPGAELLYPAFDLSADCTTLPPITDLDDPSTTAEPPPGESYVVFPQTEEERNHSQLPATPDAPVGACALQLARKLGYPDKWKARMRPTAFMLGPPKTGTTYLAECFHHAMTGDPTHRPYPWASERWPLSYHPRGEPLVEIGVVPRPFETMWNRTGFRRWDFPKESCVYNEWVQASPLRRGYQKLRFPPVEEESKNWVLLDGTPDYLMKAHVADEVAREFKGAFHQPRFLITLRNAMSRGYSHFVLMQELFVGTPGHWESLSNVFVDVLERQDRMLRQRPVCQQLLDKPSTVLESPHMVPLALMHCVYETTDSPFNNLFFLTFGYVELALRYWMQKFPKSTFRFIYQDTLKTMDEKAVMKFLGETYDMKPMLPRCESEQDWANPNCTGHHHWKNAMDKCKSGGKRMIEIGAWTERSASLGYSKGPEERIARFEQLAAQWDADLRRFLAEEELLVYDPARGYVVPEP